MLQVAAPQDVDDDGSGTIGYEEFLKMMTHKILNRDPKDATWTALKTEISGGSRGPILEDVEKHKTKGVSPCPNKQTVLSIDCK